ncbi:MAG: glycosyl hydrolase [Thermoguttaceae bacterium]
MFIFTDVFKKFTLHFIKRSETKSQGVTYSGCRIFPAGCAALLTYVLIFALCQVGNGAVVLQSEAEPTQSSWKSIQTNFGLPPTSYNSRPLWFWNSVPQFEETESIIKDCAKSGYAGLAILPAFSQDRMKFMSPEFLAQYKHAADVAKEHGMKLCLYDEFWFPSGSAGGLLKEKYPQHLCKRLDCVETRLGADDTTGVELDIPDGTLMGCVAMNLRTMERKNITNLVKENKLRWSKSNDSRDEYKIMAFVCVLDGERDLVDYLEPESVKAFIELTYAGYQKAMPDHFGTTIDSAFYDEPMLYTPGKGSAWTPKFNEYFEKRFGYDPVPLYPALFMEIGPDTAAARNALFGFRATLFSEGFVKTITDWLEPYGIPLTGHVDQEEVVNPTGVSGDIIKFFEYQPIPGLDQIFQYGRGSKMYKLISSAAANYDRHLVMTEVYGAMQEMPVDVLYKEAMDQAAKGVNMFVPHAVWYNDAADSIMFPPELSARDPKYGPALPDYNKYIGRLHLILQQPGGPVTDVAVLYPIESLQSTYHFGGPLPAYEGGVVTSDDNYMRIGEFLSFVLRRDFTYLHPATLKNRSVIENGQITAAEKTDAGNANVTLLKLQNESNPISFSTILIPSMNAISLSTLEKIVEFYESGGRIIAVGKLPQHAAEVGTDKQVQEIWHKLFGEICLMTPEPQYTITASSQWTAGGYSPDNAFDGSYDTRWNAADKSEGNQWLEINFDEPAEVAQIVIDEAFNRINKFKIQTKNSSGGEWKTQVSGEKIGQKHAFELTPAKVSGVRIVMESITSDSASIKEVEIYDSNGNTAIPAKTVNVVSQTNKAGGEATWILLDPTQALDTAKEQLLLALGDGDVMFDLLPDGTATGSSAYLHRVIHDRDVYFFTNSTDSAVKTEVSLRNGKDKRFHWWDPHSGNCTAAEVLNINGDRAVLMLELEPVKSVFLIGE